MIRLVNDITGFSYFNTTNRDSFGSSKYPNQYGQYLNKYTTIRFKNTITHSNYYRFRIPSKYSNYNPVMNSELYPKFFRIVRFDNDIPNKAILIGDITGEVLVCKASDLLTLQNINCDFCNKVKHRAELNEYSYFEPNETLSEDYLLKFFEDYNKEIVYEYPVQNMDLLGREVWIEFNSDLTLPKSNQNIITKQDYITGEEVPVKNTYKFTSEMRKRLEDGNSKLLNEKDYYLASYPHTYNIHSQSKIDMPRRTTKKGIIIRADMQSVEPHIVVMEYSESNSVRYICDDEARFYIDTDISNNGNEFNAFDTTSYYTPYGYGIDTSESSEEETDTQEEENSEEDNTDTEEETKELAYEDVVIYLKDEEEVPEEEIPEEDNTVVDDNTDNN